MATTTWLRFPVSRSLLTAAVCIVLSGCAPKVREVAPSEAVVTPVSKPLQREVTDYVEFTGRTNAVESVNIVPRVTGYLTKMPFKEGAEVKAGDLLFEIDPRPYQAQFDQAQGQVALYQAQLQLARTTLARDRDTRGVASAQQIDQDQAAVDEAVARVKAFQASTEIYKLNHYCPVKSRIRTTGYGSGRSDRGLFYRKGPEKAGFSRKG